MPVSPPCRLPRVPRHCRCSVPPGPASPALGEGLIPPKATVWGGGGPALSALPGWAGKAAGAAGGVAGGDARGWAEPGAPSRSSWTPSRAKPAPLGAKKVHPVTADVAPSRAAPRLPRQVLAKPLLRRWAQPGATPGEGGYCGSLRSCQPWGSLGRRRVVVGCLLKTMD